MSGGSAGARAVVTSQGAFTGQFDIDMNKQQLIGGKANLQQFDHVQQALSNATVKICTSKFTEDAQYVINNLEEVKMAGNSRQ